MKVTLYTINNCPFCDQEKAYLQAKGVAFEEKNLDQNRQFLTEMLAIGNNFKGVPVTKVDKDDGQSVVLKGFTQEEFDHVFVGSPTAVSASSDAPSNGPQAPQPDPATPPAPAPTPPPVVEEPTPPPPPAPEPVTPEVPTDTQVKADGASTPTPPTDNPTPPSAPEPVVPEPTPAPVVEPTTGPQAPTPPESPPPAAPQPEKPADVAPASDPLAAILQDLQNKSSNTPGPVVPPASGDVPTNPVPPQTPTPAPDPAAPPVEAPTPPAIPDFPK